MIAIAPAARLVPPDSRQRVPRLSKGVAIRVTSIQPAPARAMHSRTVANTACVYPSPPRVAPCVPAAMPAAATSNAADPMRPIRVSTPGVPNTLIKVMAISATAIDGPIAAIAPARNDRFTSPPDMPTAGAALRTARK